MITRKSSVSSLCQSGKANSFLNVSIEFSSFSILSLFVKAYKGLKDKPVNIVRIVVFYQCISTGFYLLGGGSFPQKVSASPKKFSWKKLKLFQIKIFFDGDFKESVKVTDVQKKKNKNPR